MKTVELIYLDTCLPDYFQGFNGATIAVYVSGDSDLRYVRQCILDEIQMSDMPEADYEPLKASALALFSDCKDLSKKWDSLLPQGEQAEDSGVYAYFGIKESE